MDMKIVAVENYEEMSKKCADIMAETIKKNPHATLGLMTGATVSGIYKKLIEKNKNKEISFKDVRTINLDEYVGLNKNNRHSCGYFMNTGLFDRVDINGGNILFLRGISEDMHAECKRYDELLDKYPRDIQLLEIGNDGSIGFNDPGTPFGIRTHIAELSISMIFNKARLFGKIEDVPVRAITVGIPDIMKAKSVLLIANGTNKAEALRAMIKGEINESCPASILQKHINVTVIADREALSLL